MSLQQTILISSVTVLVALIITIDRILVRRRAFKRFETRLRRYALWAPTILGLATAYGLVSAALERGILSPFRSAPDTTLGTLLVISELIAAAFLILGLFTRLAALVVLICALFVVVTAPWLASLPFIVVFGNSFFMLVWGRGRFSLGSFISRFVAMDPAHIRPVTSVILRISVAATLVFYGLHAITDTRLIPGIIYLGGAMLTVFSSFPRFVAAGLLVMLAVLQQSAPYLAGALGALLILGKANDLNDAAER